MDKDHKDWILRFESTPKRAKEIEKIIESFKDTWQIDLEEITASTGTVKK